jgi:transcriptional antiterminator NusG
MSEQNEAQADKLSAEGLAAAAQEDVQQSVSDLQAQAGQAGESDGEEAPVSAEDAALEAYKTRLREFMRALKKLPGSWYIIQCYSGYENKV